jgi:hypothetical protein
LRVGEDVAKTIVGLDQRALASHNIDAEDVREALVPLVVGDQELIWEVA